MTIRVDRRALYFLLGIVLLGIPMAIGLYVGGFMSPPAAPNQAAGTPASPAASGLATSAPAAVDQAAPPAGDDALAGVPRITVEDAKKKLDDGNTVFIDARTPDQFGQGHIKGALSIPETDAVAKAADLPKDKDLILYCT